MDTKHVGPLREALVSISQEIAEKQAQTRQLSQTIIEVGREINELEAGYKAIEAVIQKLSPDPSQVVEDSETSHEDDETQSAGSDQPPASTTTQENSTRKESVLTKQPTSAGIKFFKEVFNQASLPGSLEEALETTGSNWRERRILIGRSSDSEDGERRNIYVTYQQDLVDTRSSRLLRQLADDWLRLTVDRSQPFPIGVNRVITQIREHSTTPQERVRVLTSWGLPLNTEVSLT